MEFRLQAESFVAEPFRLKAELHAYFVCFVISLSSSLSSKSSSYHDRAGATIAEFGGIAFGKGLDEFVVEVIES